MAQIVGCLEGMGDACRALDYPIVSGNVSLYNESKATGGGSAILPTPAIGGVGVLEDVSKMATIGFKAEGNEIFVIGDNNGYLGQSLWLRELHGREDGDAPVVDLGDLYEVSKAVRELIDSGIARAVHDVSDGGLLVAVAEMALSTGIGANLWCDDLLGTAELFSEVQTTYVLEIDFERSHEAHAIVERAGLLEKWHFLGEVGGDSVKLACNKVEVPLSDLRVAHESFFKNWMES
jgi:phosphoribosylformylglycinamidine synthase subunit PurL